MKVEVKVGFFVLAAIVLLAFGAAFVGNITIGGSGYEFSVSFKFSGDLRIRSKVKMAGGEVIGSVTNIAYNDVTGTTNIQVRIREGVKIKKNAVISIMTSGLMGEKYINISGGTPDSGLVQAGDVVHGDTSGGMDGAMTKASEVMGELQKTLSSLNSVVGTKETKVALQSAVSGLSETVTASQPKIVNILNNLESMTESMKKASQSLNEVTTSMNKMSGEKNQLAITRTLQNLEEATTKLNSTIENVEAITKKIEAGQGAVGLLISDKKVADDLRSVMKNLKDVSENPSRILFGPPKK